MTRGGISLQPPAWTLYAASGGIILVVLGQRLVMRSHPRPDETMDM